MKISLNGATPDAMVNHANSGPAAGSDSVNHVVAEDRATLSVDRQTIDQLTSQAMATSETRQERVALLRQSIASGQYAVEPDKMAEAMLKQLRTTEMP